MSRVPYPNSGECGSASLRVMTFNIRHGASAWGTGRLGLERTADVIRRAAPDVVALQEVDRCFGPRSAWQDQPAQLADLTGLPYVLYAPAITRPPTDGRTAPREYGIALLSRLPLHPAELAPASSFAAAAAMLLPLAQGASAEGEPRVALAATVAVPHAGSEAGERDLLIITTHLEAFIPAHRRAQTEHLARALAPQRGAAVLLGDMNTRAGAPELAPLRRTGWREARSGQWSLARLLGRTFPSRLPLRRIDQIRTRGPVRAHQVRTVRTWASDHCAVTAELEVR